MKFNKVLLPIILSLCITGCSETTESQTEKTPSEIYNEMLSNYNNQKYIIMECNKVNDSLEVVSTNEAYADLEKDFYTCIYAEGDEIVYQGKLSQKDLKEYLYTDYGWLEQDTTTDMRTVFTNFFSFVNSDYLKLADDIADDSPIDKENSYVLESLSQSKDGSYIYYDSIVVDKETMLPRYVSIQTYKKNSEDDTEITTVTDENGNDLSYTNVILDSTIYLFEFCNEGLDNWDLFTEANAIPEDNIITQDEYNNLAWKVNGNNEQEDN